HPHATNGAFETKDGLVMLGASNLRQQRRLWTVLGRPDMIKRTNDERDEDHDREIAVLSEIMLTRTADEWEEFLQARHVPAARVRTMGEALADPQLATRGVVHRHAAAPGLEGGFGVPLAAFTFAQGEPRSDLKLGVADGVVAAVAPGDGVNAPPAPPYDGLDHCVLTVRGIGAVVAEVKDRGVEFTKAPTTVRAGVRVAFLRAPEGV